MSDFAQEQPFPPDLRRFIFLLFLHNTLEMDLMARELNHAFSLANYRALTHPPPPLLPFLSSCCAHQTAAKRRREEEEDQARRDRESAELRAILAGGRRVANARAEPQAETARREEAENKVWNVRMKLSPLFFCLGL